MTYGAAASILPTSEFLSNIKGRSGEASPHRQGCEGEFYHAQKEILVQDYSYTSAPIAKALLDAHKRGIRVEVILDKSQVSQKYSTATFFHNQGIPIKIDRSHAIAHNKIMIIDQGAVITGSFNFTKAAEEKNAENLLLIKDRGLAGKYIQNWKELERHSDAHKRPSILYGVTEE